MGNSWTKGPYKIDRSKIPTDGEYDYGIGADGELIAEVYGRTSETNRPNAKATARLLASAPDLYAALEGDWADKLHAKLLDDYAEPDPTTGEVVTSDILPHFKALCNFIEQRNIVLSQTQTDSPTTTLKGDSDV